jgi:type VI secretion system protein ImpD
MNQSVSRDRHPLQVFDASPAVRGHRLVTKQSALSNPDRLDAQQPTTAAPEFAVNSLPSVSASGLRGARTTANVEIDAAQISRVIAGIDRKISGLLDRILHHPRFQALEASWRGLHGLVHSVPRDANIQFRVLHAPWRELARDFDRSPEFDSSQLFRKVYSEAFGTAGGYPYGLLIGDYEIRPWPGPDHPISDCAVLKGISEAAAAAFAVFVTGAHPALLGIDEWRSLERPINFSRIYELPEFAQWNAFREAEERMFVGITLPPVLVRAPYDENTLETRGLCYRENTRGTDASRLLWGNAAYAFAKVVARSYAETNWPASIRGATRHIGPDGVPDGVTEWGGLVSDLPVLYSDADEYRTSSLSPTIVSITDELESQLSRLGFIPLTRCANTPYCAFYSNRSIRKVPRMDTAWATQNAEASAQLQYVLCTARFAHFLKIIARDYIGSYVDAKSLEIFLNSWLRNYVTTDTDASPAMRAQYPLRQAAVVVKEVPDRPGAFTSIVHILPHCELDDLRVGLSFRSELFAGKK